MGIFLCLIVTFLLHLLTLMRKKFNINIGDIMETKAKKYIVYFVIAVSILFVGVLAFVFLFNQNESIARATDEVQEMRVSTARTVNLNDIVMQNMQDEVKEEFFQVEEVLEYLTTYITNPEVPRGISYVIQEGRTGTQLITIQRTHINGDVVSEEPVRSTVTRASINRIVQIGGGPTTSNHRVRVGDEVFVTSDRLAVHALPIRESERITTLTQGTMVEILEIVPNWYRISHGFTTGWVVQENTTYFYRDREITLATGGGGISRATALSRLNFNMPLTEPSGLSIDQFRRVLTDERDRHNMLQDNAEYFFYVERQYGINGVFLAALAIHESAWGTSQIARQKNNLFGYGAFDRDPFNSAWTFSTPSEGIDLVARVLVNHYLHPRGTPIHSGNTAAGTFFNGNNLAGVNVRYATDRNWANAVFNHMRTLINKL